MNKWYQTLLDRIKNSELLRDKFIVYASLDETQYYVKLYRFLKPSVFLTQKSKKSSKIQLTKNKGLALNFYYLDGIDQCKELISKYNKQKKSSYHSKYYVVWEE